LASGPPRAMSAQPSFQPRRISPIPGSLSCWLPALWLSWSCSSRPLLGCVSACRRRQTGELPSKNHTNLSSHGRSTGAKIGVLAEVSRLEIRASSLDLLRRRAFPRRGYRPSREPGEVNCWRNECVLERTSRWLEERSRKALPIDRSRCCVFEIDWTAEIEAK
jgi:hypothetical protein